MSKLQQNKKNGKIRHPLGYGKGVKNTIF